MIQTTKIVDVMGGEEVLQQTVTSLFELEQVVEQGLPKGTLRHVASFVAPFKERFKFMYRVVPEGTYKRRRTHLSREESERTERLARVIATALHVWDDSQKARDFLNNPHFFFKERAPIEVAFTELGARQVEEFLWGIFYGLPL